MEFVSFVNLLDLHIAVEEFYLFHLRRASIFAQRKLQTSGFHEKQSIIRSLSRILDKYIFDNFSCDHRSTFQTIL